MQVAKRTHVLAVLGGIGSGKSAVARRLEEHGALRIDADQLAREALEDPEVRRALAEELGADLLGTDGRPDRARIAARVFPDPEALAFLEALLHPKVRERIGAALEAARRSGRTVVVLDVPLLLERSPFVTEVDTFIFVDCPAEERRKRAVLRHGGSAEDFARRESLQTPLPEKRRLAPVVFDNSGDLASLHVQVDRWWDGFAAKFG